MFVIGPCRFTFNIAVLPDIRYPVILAPFFLNFLASISKKKLTQFNKIPYYLFFWTVKIFFFQYLQENPCNTKTNPADYKCRTKNIEILKDYIV